MEILIRLFVYLIGGELLRAFGALIRWGIHNTFNKNKRSYSFFRNGNTNKYEQQFGVDAANFAVGAFSLILLLIIVMKFI